MKQLAIFLGSLLYSTIGLCQGAVIMQDKTFIYQHTKDSALLKEIGKGDYKSMSSLEQESVYWIACMRRNPPAFFSQYVKPFLDQFPELQSSSARSLEKELKAQSPLPVLIPASNLNKAAVQQVHFLTESRRFSHSGPKGKSFQQRMADVGVRECAGENLFEGKSDPMVSLMLLLIDHGVEGFGHRRALLNPAFTKIGIGVTNNLSGGTMLVVQDFSCL